MQPLYVPWFALNSFFPIFYALLKVLQETLIRSDLPIVYIYSRVNNYPLCFNEACSRGDFNIPNGVIELHIIYIIDIVFKYASISQLISTGYKRLSL